MARIKTPHNLMWDVMGIGSFILFLLLILILFLWILTSPCTDETKIALRTQGLMIFFFVASILIFSEKESMYTYPDIIEPVYDMSFIPRISMFCIQFGFMVAGGVFFVVHSGESKDMKDEPTYTDLWRE